MKNPLFAFFGTSADSQFALAQLERRGLVPALIVDTKELPVELYNSEWGFFVVASYGKILSKKVLELPKHGCINIHPSLLPDFKGAHAIRDAFESGVKETGVTVHIVTADVDAGPIVSQKKVLISKKDSLKSCTRCFLIIRSRLACAV